MTDRETLFPARDQALELLDDLCRDSLEMPLSHVVSMTDAEAALHDIAWKFRWLHDLIAKEMSA